MFCPSEPCCNLLLVVSLRYVFQLVERAHLPAKILFYALTDKFLLSIEFIPHVTKCPSMTVVSVYGNRKYLPVALYLELQLILDIRINETMEQFPELVLARMEEYKIVRIFAAINPIDFINPVHEVCHGKVRKIL